MRRTLLVAAILAIFLAGCGEDPSGTVPSGSEMLPPEPTVPGEIAKAWSDSARLVRVLGIESADSRAPRQGDLASPFYDDVFSATDPNIGDGNAMAWTLSYAAPDKDKLWLNIIVNSTGIQAQEEGPAGPATNALDSTHPTTGNIASFMDDVAAGWKSGNAARGAIVWTLLYNNGATWTLEGAIDETGTVRSYTFDAVSGTALSSLARREAEELAKNADSRTGELTAANSVTEFQVEFKPGHAYVEFNLNSTGPVASGEVGAFAEVGNDTFNISSGQTRIEFPAAGLWHFTLQMNALAVTQTFTLSWCAPGGTVEQACP